MKRVPSIFAALIIGFFIAGCQHAPSTENLPAVTGFELKRYLGAWYEIARLPHYFERGLHEVKAEYTLNSDDTVTVLNTGVKNGKSQSITGVAKLQSAAEIGWLRVSFFRPFYGDYKIIYLEKDYSAAIVTSGTMDYLWILSRTPRLEQSRLDAYLAKIKAWGFAVEKLEYPAPVKL